MFSKRVKDLSISIGLYRMARWLSRYLRPTQLQAFRDEVDFYRSLLPPGSLCFDVGANIGDKSEAMLKAGLRVVAFEPSPVALRELRSRCAQNNNWTLVAAAVGERAGFATLYGPEDSAKSTLDADFRDDIIQSNRVPVVTLTSAISKFGTPYYCKIDVEGWELNVLRGLEHPLRLLSFEFHLGKEKNIANTTKCLDRLLEFGPAVVNITPSESSRFHFSEWIPLERFREWFPGNLASTLPGDSYGDIYVKNETITLD